MPEVNHSERKHALLSASKAERWLNCPPSARLEEKFNESHPVKTSIYAEEGTLAHEFANTLLEHELGNLTDKEFSTQMGKLKKDKLFSEEMLPEVQKYVDYVLEEYAQAKAKTKDAVCLVEQTLDFSNYVEQGYGMGDACIIADGVLEVIDLKYGKGVQVDAVENPQLSLYGLGALNIYDMVFDIHTVKLTIFQPRINNYSTWETSVENLKKWGETVVKPIAIKAYVGEGLHKAGDHCKWCSVKAMCYTLAQRNIKLARNDFKEPELIPLKDLIAIYKQIPMLVDWANSVAEFLKDEAVGGKEIPGYKLVEGKSQRKYINEDKFKEALLANGYSLEDITKVSLKGIPAIEKLVGASAFNKEYREFWDRPQGSPTLVDESDPRPALGSSSLAKADFAEEV